MYTRVGQDILLDDAAEKFIGSKGDPIAAFGKRTSEVVWKAVSQAAPGMQRVQMMAILDALDPRLWDVVNTKALKFQAEKGYSARKALKHALSAAFANNLVKDFLVTGKFAEVPQQGLLGLGVYGEKAQIGAYLNYRHALGSAMFTIQSTAASTLMVSQAVQCAAQGKVAAPCHYQRKRAGDPAGNPGPNPKPGYVWVCDACGISTPKVMKDAEGNCPPGYMGTRSGTCVWGDKRCEPGFAYAWDVKGCVPYAERPGRDMIVGPFFFDSTKENQKSSVYHGTRRIPADWKKFFADEIRDHALIRQPAGGFRLGEKAGKFGIDKWLGFKDDERIRFDKDFFNGEKPLLKFKHPIDGRNYGLYLIATKENIYATAHPYVKPKSWWGKLWGKIKSIAATIVGAIVDVIKKVAGLVCKVVTHPAGQMAAAGGAVAMGAPPDVAIIGTQVAAGICATADIPSDIPLFEPERSSMLVPLALGAAALAAVFLLKKKKR